MQLQRMPPLVVMKPSSDILASIDRSVKRVEYTNKNNFKYIN